MQRFFVPHGALTASASDSPESGRTAVLTGKDFHYLAHVRRLAPGDSLPACTPDGSLYVMTIQQRGTDRLQVILLPDSAHRQPAMAPPLIIAQAVVKPAPMDLIIRQATELGVAAIVPVVTERSVPRGHAQPRLPRWLRIARSATQQCGRERPPEIEIPCGLAELLTEAPGSAVKLVFHPPSDTETALDLPEVLEPATVWMLLGPEGGFSASELELTAAAGFRRCTLGSTVLRTETAVVAAITATRLLLHRSTIQHSTRRF